MPLRAQPHGVRIGRGFHQTPFFHVEGAFRVEAGNAIPHVTNFRDATHHVLLDQIGCAVTANISAVAFALSTGGPLPSCPMQMARLARTM